MIKIPKDLKLLSKMLDNKLYIVGGFLRDNLLKNKTHDIDLCSHFTIKQLQEKLNNSCYKVEPTNLQFGTAKIICKNNTWEYCTFRKDVYSPTGKHSPKKVEFVSTLEEDCLRRDFTINAIYYDIANNKIIDPFGGKLDLEKRLLKAVPPATEILSHDGERLIRMAKFKAKLGLNIEDNTFLLAKRYCNNIKDLSTQTINKFLLSVKNFNLKQKEELKQILNLLNAQELAEKI